MEAVNESPDLKSSAESLLRNAKDYAEARLDLILLNTQEKAADVVASVSYGFIISLLMLFTLFFLSVGAAWYIGELTGRPFIGFLSIGLFYIILTGVLFAFRKTWIHAPVMNKMIKQISWHEED